MVARECKKVSPLVYFASDCKVDSYCGDRDAFMGNYRDENAPLAVEVGACNNQTLASGNPCAALQISMLCEPKKVQCARFFLGAAEGGIADYASAKSKVDLDIRALRDLNTVNAQYALLKARYEAHFANYRCEIPDEIAQRQINYWGPLNALQFSLFHQTPQPSAPGVRGIGARDKTQALMAMVYRNPEGVKRSMLFMLSVQFTNGAMSHNIDGEMNVYGMTNPFSMKTIKSDDHLWMPFLAYAVVAESDASVLEEKIPYHDLRGNPTKKTETVWRHLMRAIEFTASHIGEHGLPLMLRGDWNDIISKFSCKGKGESVFVSQQYIAALDRMIALAKHCGYQKDLARLEHLRNDQEKALLACAWNGKWWSRGFDDDGNPIGTDQNVFGKLWLNPQTWAVISNTGSKEQQRQGMDAVDQTLDTGYGLKLLDPGFKTYPIVSDPFSSYNPGTGENGAVFCHAHTWSIIAYAKLGDAEKAWKYYLDLIPHNLVGRLGIETYRSDPYGWVSNIVGPENSKHGWGNVIRLTGTAAWMNIAATQYLLGIRTTLDGIKFDPCIPNTWESYTVNRMYRGCMLHITIENSEKVSKGVVFVDMDGVRHTGNLLAAELFENKTEANVVVRMGVLAKENYDEN